MLHRCRCRSSGACTPLDTYAPPLVKGSQVIYRLSPRCRCGSSEPSLPSPLTHTHSRSAFMRATTDACLCGHTYTRTPTFQVGPLQPAVAVGRDDFMYAWVHMCCTHTHTHTHTHSHACLPLCGWAMRSVPKLYAAQLAVRSTRASPKHART